VRKAFTLVEIMIVVAVIGLLAAIAIPNFVQARSRAQRTACIANLKKIQDTISLWAIDNGKTNTDAVTMANLVPAYLRSTPYCPLDSAKTGYTLTTVGAATLCPSDPTSHVLP